MRKLFTMLALAVSLALPTLVQAADTVADYTGLQSTGNSAAYLNADNPTRTNIYVLIGTYIIQPVLGIVGIIFFMLMIYAGILWMTAAGNSDRVKKAKDILRNAIIGVVIVTAAYAITAAVFNAVTEGNVTGVTT